MFANEWLRYCQLSMGAVWAFSRDAAGIISEEALQLRQTPNRWAHTQTSWMYLQPLICPLIKVNEITTHICLLRAFLFWLEVESTEETENKKCNSLLLLAQIRLVEAHTSTWQQSTHGLCFCHSSYPSWHPGDFIWGTVMQVETVLLQTTKIALKEIFFFLFLNEGVIWHFNHY